MCSSASRWAARASRAVSSAATVRAVSADRPLASYRAVSSVSSASGVAASSRFSCSICACSLSRWLDTETYSPSAIDTAPPTSPASPAVKIGPRDVVAPATPMTMPATDTIPSLAPSTAARSQFSRPRGRRDAAPGDGSPARPRPPRPEQRKACHRQRSCLSSRARTSPLTPRPAATLGSPYPDPSAASAE